MSFDPAWLTDTITVQRKTGNTAAGDPTYGSPFTMPARVETQGQRMVETTGDALDDTTTLFTLLEIQKTDLVWFPGDSTASTEAAHRPVNVAQLKDLDGVLDHYESSF